MSLGFMLPSDVEEFSGQHHFHFPIFAPGVGSQAFSSKPHAPPPGMQPTLQAHPRSHMSKYLKVINQAKNR